MYILVFVLSFISIVCTHAQNAKCLIMTVGQPVGCEIDGFGIEFDPHFLSQNVTAGNGTKATDWDSIIIPRLRKLNPSKLRIMVLPEWYEPVNDNNDPNVVNVDAFNFESPEMQGLYSLLDIAEQDGIKVTLTFWGTRSSTFLLPKALPGWMMGPSEFEEWAENLSTCLNYLLNKRHYTCIYEVTPVNEPDWAFSTDQHNQADLYIQMCKVLNERLRHDGLREQIRMSLSDNSDAGTGTNKFLAACTKELSHEADIFNSHTYIFGYDTPNSTICQWEAENVKLSAQTGKAHFVGEFGSNQTVGSTIQRDIDRYERGLLMARIVINLLNAGACGASYWSLLDQYYSRREAISRSNMQRLGLWRYLKEEYAQDSIYAHINDDYQVRPQYYAIGMLSNHLRWGSVIYPLDTKSEWIAATALKSAEGRWSYLFVNPTSEAVDIELTNPHSTGKHNFQVYRYEEASLPEDDSLIQPTGQTILHHGKIKERVESRSFIIITER